MLSPAKIALAPSPSFLQKLFDSLNDIICALDQEGRFVYINQACYKMWGYKPEEVIGVICYDMMVPDDKVTATTAVQEVVTLQTQADAVENHYYHKDGSVVTMRWEAGGFDPETGLIYSNGKNISEQRKLQQLAQKHQEDLEQLLERVADGFLGLNQNAEVIYWNKAAEAISGLSQKLMVGQLLWDVLPEPSRSIARSKLPMITEGSKPLHMEYFTDRLQIWIEVNAYGSSSGVSVFFRDVTERHRLQAQLLEEKEQQQKRITTAVFKATEEERAHVSKELHDNVNQVLTTVKLYNELCLSNPSRSVELLQKSTQLLQASINEIRGLSKRLSAPALGGISLKESLEDLAQAINETNRLKVSYAYDGIESEVSQIVHIAIYRIMQEHFTNVLKHAEATEAQVHVECQGSGVTLTVVDNGCGFDPLAPRKGIGLENIKSRAESIGAKLELISSVGSGCTLRLIVPIEEGA